VAYKSKRALILFLFSLVLLFLFGIVLVKKRRAELNAYKPPPSYPVPVEFAVVKRGAVKERFNYYGRVEPYSYATVSTKVAGLVLKVYKREGESFKKGETLVLLDSSEITNELLALKNEAAGKRAQERAVEAQIESAKVALKNAEAEYRRELFLYEKGAAPKEAVEKAQNLYAQAEAKLKSLESQLKELRYAVRSINRKEQALSSKLRYARVRAVKDGVVSQLLVHEGDTAVPGKPLLKVFYPSDGFRVLVSVPPKVASALEVGGEVLVEGRPLGAVKKVYPAAEPNGLLTVEVSLKELGGLKPNQLVSVTLPGKVYRGEELPVSALLHLKGGTFVLLLEGEKVKPVKVEVLKEFNGVAVISPVLPEGAKVAVGRESKLLRVYRLGRAVPAEAFNG
jgi:multidrug efflux pump subunit AcrA (membrane-fusion protein)